ncbi:MAG: hypothetical protein ABIK92_18705 [Pseudomonadota bacterium]
MRIAKAMIITVMFGIAIGLFPKTSSARDVSVGISLGIPVPFLKVYHALPSPPPPPWAFYKNRSYYRKADTNRTCFQNDRDYKYRGEVHGYNKQEERQNRYDHNNGYREQRPRKR